MNWTHPPGTPCIYTEIRGLPSTARLTRTSSPAWESSGHERVRIADGDEFGVPVEHLVALPEPGQLPHARGTWPPDAYPLCWPRNVPQRLKAQRKTSRFSNGGCAWTPEAAWIRIAATAEIIGARRLIVSTDLHTWLDVDRHAGFSRPVPSTNPGVAAWMELNGTRYVFAIDRYTLTACNMIAIANVIANLKKIEQQSPDMFARAMQGFVVDVDEPAAPTFIDPGDDVS